MNNSLLAHLYPYIKGSQEDVATYSLHYLLSQSSELNTSFTKKISEILNISSDTTLRYSCQVTGDSEERERPDMAGVDASGRETVLFEMKFYASLTQNQPNTYLKRLKNNHGNGLLFICPESRKTNLWAKLTDLCKDNTMTEISAFCIETDGIKLAITTWKEIIDTLKSTIISDNNNIKYDILQLEGYCNKMDSDAFIPFSAEDLSALTAIKEERFFSIIDEVSELLKADTSRHCEKIGKTNAYRGGYSSKLTIDNYNLELLYDRYMWKNPETVETPFWISFSDTNRKQTKAILDKIMSYPEKNWDNSVYTWTYLALEPLQNSTKAEVSEDLKNKILAYINILDQGS